MFPEAHEMNISAGRLRIRVPGKKRDVAYFGKLVESFTSLNGIQEIRVNPLTTSVLFVHDLEVKAIAEHAKELSLFRLKSEEGIAQRNTIFEAANKTIATWNRQLKNLTGGGMDVPSLVFLGLVLTGFYQISKGNFRAPPWYTAFWYALGIFSKAAFDELSELGDFGEDWGD